MAEIFHINERVLDINGFVKHIWGDKDSPNDTFNTLKFEEYIKELRDDLKIVVGYTYTTEDEKEYKLHSSGISLVFNEEFEAVLKIKDLGDFLTLIRILQGDE